MFLILSFFFQFIKIENLLIFRLQIGAVFFQFISHSLIQSELIDKVAMIIPKFTSFIAVPNKERSKCVRFLNKSSEYRGR